MTGEVEFADLGLRQRLAPAFRAFGRHRTHRVAWHVEAEDLPPSVRCHGACRDETATDDREAKALPRIIGKALSAAEQTVPQERRAHSLHGYFLRKGDTSLPIVYDVDCIRDGRSFTTRRVVAIQHGRAIFHLSASFQRREPGVEY